MSHADRYHEWVGTVERVIRQRAARALQLEQIAAVEHQSGPATIGGLPVTVEERAYQKVAKDRDMADLRSARDTAIALATMYGLGAVLDALTRPPAPSTTNGDSP